MTGTIVVPSLNAVLIANGIQRWVLTRVDTPGIVGTEITVIGDGEARHGDSIDRYRVLETAYDRGPDYTGPRPRFDRHGSGPLAVYDGRRTPARPAGPWPIERYALPYATATVARVLPVAPRYGPIHRLEGGHAILVRVYDHQKPHAFGLTVEHSDDYSGRTDEYIDRDQRFYCDWRGVKDNSDHFTAWAWELVDAVAIPRDHDEDDDD